MDRHDVSKSVTAETIAQLHLEDLKIQHEFGCKGMTYWFDAKRNTAFCLIEAPNKEAVEAMHNHAHGELPNCIIEVDTTVVESFLGRIEDPKTKDTTDLNIINDSPFRILMLIKTSNYLNRLEAYQLTLFSQKFHNNISKTLDHYNGSIVKNDNNSYLVSFKSASDAVQCLLKIHYQFKYVTPKFDASGRKLNISLTTGNPVTDKASLYEESICLAKYICDTIKEPLVITSEVKTLYENENKNAIIDNTLIRVLKPKEEKFLTQLMNTVETIWNKPDITVDEFSKVSGYSKSQFYRKLMTLTSLSPNQFLKEYRLHKAIKLLHLQMGNISEIAFETGFNSPSYFSKCFVNTYGILPSKYVQQHLN
ncbi:nickel-binding protein [Aestuariivivens insulae]|uniref:nickel-binding protein n=1 Tax=Aestuariivivens insulae TaxID=1621988 RepID=UPI001F592944|nr:nickel-binding protein [Aestuariivivens insulae]